MTEKKTRVVVIGGGYAGVLAANHLRLNQNIAITMVNPRPSFVERIRLHQLVTGSNDAVVDYATVLGQGITLAVDSVTKIDAAARRVELASGDSLGYDYLIYAVGSAGATPTVPGADEFAYPISEYEHAGLLRTAVAAAAADAPLCVVGAGPTGLETAAELAEEGRRVTLICGSVLGPYLSTRARRAAAKRMTQTRRHRHRRPGRDRHRGAPRCGGSGRRPQGGQRGDDLDRGFRRARPRSPQRPEHRWHRPPADRRDADQRRRPAHRRCRRCVGPVEPAAADELPGGDPARRPGREHGAEPDRRH